MTSLPEFVTARPLSSLTFSPPLFLLYSSIFTSPKHAQDALCAYSYRFLSVQSLRSSVSSLFSFLQFPNRIVSSLFFFTRFFHPFLSYRYHPHLCLHKSHLLLPLRPSPSRACICKITTRGSKRSVLSLLGWHAAPVYIFFLFFNILV